MCALLYFEIRKKWRAEHPSSNKVISIKVNVRDLQYGFNFIYVQRITNMLQWNLKAVPCTYIKNSFSVCYEETRPVKCQSEAKQLVW